MPDLTQTLDVWLALGLPSEEFDGYVERNGYAITWSMLVDQINVHPMCGDLDEDGEPCVLREHSIGPCYAEGDVGRSEPLPNAT